MPLIDDLDAAFKFFRAGQKFRNDIHCFSRSAPIPAGATRGGGVEWD